MVDSQSFPLQVPGFTDLSSEGAYSSSMVYTPSDVNDIVAYAGAVSIFDSFLSTGWLSPELYFNVDREGLM